MENVKNKGFLKRGVALLGRTTDTAGLTLSTNGVIPLFETVNFSDMAGLTVLSTTQIKLAAGRKYKMTGAIPHSSSAANYVKCRVYDVTAGAYVGLPSHDMSATVTGHDNMANLVQAIVAPTVDTTYEIRVFYISAGTFNVLFNGAQLLVEELEALAPQAGVADFIIERGSNANGEYEKWYSGKLEQWAYGKQSTSDASSAARNFSVTFPIAFASTNYTVLADMETPVNTNYDFMIFATKVSPSTTGCTIQANQRGAVATTGYGYLSWRAIGRWK